MHHSLMIVESRPASADDAAAYHSWYDDKHIPEILGVEGFVSARRLKSTDGDLYITVYEIGGDVAAAKDALGRAQAAGIMSPPQGLQLDPPPVVRYFEPYTA